MCKTIDESRYFLLCCWRIRAKACNCTNSNVRNWSITIRRSLRKYWRFQAINQSHTCGIEWFVSSDNESILSVITILPKKYLCSLGRSFAKIIERLSLNAVVVGLDFYQHEIRRRFSRKLFHLRSDWKDQWFHNLPSWEWPILDKDNDHRTLWMIFSYRV